LSGTRTSPLLEAPVHHLVDVVVEDEDGVQGADVASVDRLMVLPLVSQTADCARAEAVSGSVVRSTSA
jgi:hypothetical protein